MLENIPTFYPVKIGNSKFEMLTESIINSLCQQYLNHYQNKYNFDHYEMVYITVKSEVEKYVNTQIESNIECFDFLGGWLDEFIAFQNKKNEFLCKDFIVEFSDESMWSIKILDLLNFKYNGDKIDETDPFVQDENLILEWASSLKWEDISYFAEEIKRPQPAPDYNDEFINAKKEIKPWDETVNLLSFLETTFDDNED